MVWHSPHEPDRQVAHRHEATGEVILDFGKHQGKRLEQVPDTYLRWLSGEGCGMVPEDLRALAAQELQAREERQTTMTVNMQDQGGPEGPPDAEEPSVAKVHVTTAERRHFLASISHVPLRPRTLARLRQAGVHTIADLAHTKRQTITAIAGSNGNLVRHLECLVGTLRRRMAEIGLAEATAPADRERRREQPGGPSALLAMSIDSIPTPTRLLKRLAMYGAKTLGDVLKVDDERFAGLPGVGRKTIADLHSLQAAVARGKVGNAAEEMDARAEAVGPAEEMDAEQLSLDSPTDRLAMSTRLRNRLLDYGCRTVGDMLRVDTAQFGEQRGVGKTTLAELRNLRAWIRAHVPDARDVPIEEEQRRKLRLAAERTLWAAAQSPDGEIPADGLVAVTQFAPGEGPIASLADLVREVVERTVRCRSVRDVERNSAIWLAHYGVPAGKPKTLDALGRKHSLSRGRIQQIVAATTRLAKPLLRIDERYAPQLRAVREAFASCLGVGRLKDMLPLLERAAKWEAPPTCEHLVALSVLLEGTSDAFTCGKDADLVRHSRACAELWDGLGSRVQDALDDAGEGQHVLDFAYSLGQRVEACLCPGRDGQDLPIACCGARNGQVQLPPPYVRALLSTLDPCPLHGDMVLGADWATLRFGRVKREVVGAALRIIGKPVHYSELAEFVRKHGRRWRHPDDRNIHACLTCYEEFVPTKARGTYGLQEWDVRRYRTAADRVEAFLRQRGRPAPVWEIIEALVAQGVPDNNVRACLEQQRFRTQSDRTVGLNEWTRAGDRRVIAEPEVTGIFVSDADDGFIMG